MSLNVCHVPSDNQKNIFANILNLRISKEFDKLQI